MTVFLSATAGPGLAGARPPWPVVRRGAGEPESAAEGPDLSLKGYSGVNGVKSLQVPACNVTAGRDKCALQFNRPIRQSCLYLTPPSFAIIMMA